MKRLVLSSLLTLTLGVAGGAAGTRLFPSNAPSPLAARPAIASEIHVNTPLANDGIADLVDAVKLAVVNIDTVSHRRVAAMPADPFHFFFDNGQGGNPQPQQQVEKGIGSGFVVRDDGLIVTNNHVIRGADKLTVTLADGKKYTGRVIGADPGTDLALVKIDARHMTALKLADPAKLRVGQYVVAMGSPLGLSQTVTSGILSAINRDIAINARVGFLQTDAPINPGNSGGPLLNLRGEVIGVNTAIAARGQGIGFAVPVGTLQSIIPQLEANGHVDRAWLGVGVSNLPDDKSQMFYPTDHGVVVGRVERGSPADRAGLKPGDVLVSLNGQPLDSANQLIREVAKFTIGHHVAVIVSRQGQQKTLDLTLAKMPEKLADAANQAPPEAP